MENEQKYDSAIETIDHIKQVQHFVSIMISELMQRMIVHDDSKLRNPEKEWFDEHTGKLKNLVYGSKEYQESLDALKPALDHHYANNSHHPQYYENGVDDMDLLDILEMVCDWKAATMRHSTGDINKSIDINQERFKISDQLATIMRNTVRNYF